jgi:3-oxoacyl-[acyl-carrier protein] reductase
MMEQQKNIIIVGGSSSIGNSIISKFRSPSTTIIASYFTKKEIKHEGGIHPVKLDLKNDQNIEKFIAEVTSIMPYINTAIFLAGILPGKNLKEYNGADIEKVMMINFIGQVKVIKGLLPLYASGSQIIMISSISAQRGSYDPIYAASKGAILSFVKSLAVGLEGIRVNAIAPGLIQDSTMYNEMSSDRQEFHRRQTSQKKLLTMSDFADVVYDISQNHWKHLNGACIDLNGGQYVR